MEEDGENPGEFSLAVVDVQAAALAQAAATLADTQVIMICNVFLIKRFYKTSL